MCPWGWARGPRAGSDGLPLSASWEIDFLNMQGILWRTILNLCDILRLDRGNFGRNFQARDWGLLKRCPGPLLTLGHTFTPTSVKGGKYLACFLIAEAEYCL